MSEKIIKEKTPIPSQDPKERVKNFSEVALGYSEEDAVKEANRCIQCKKPYCIDGCPVDIDIPAFIKMIAEKDFDGAIAKMKEKNNLPAICGRVCPQETQCEAVCVLAKKADPVGIGRLERFIADYELKKGVVPPEKPAPTGKRVAVIGAGPAGLTCGGDLAKMGHEVVIYEALHKAGGVLIYGIPEFRLPKKVVKEEMDYIEQLGAKIETNSVIGSLSNVDELLEEFDAVFIGTGAGLPYFMNIPGENLMGVYSANEYLTRANLMKAYDFPNSLTPIKVGKNVAVIGGGNVAMDAARSALRLGAENSYIIYRRSDAELPARREEIDHAKDEGVEFRLLTSPISYDGEDGWLKSMTCIKYELGEPDDSGRRRPVPIEGSEYTMGIDVVVVAIGQGPNPLVLNTTPGLQLTKWGTIDASEETGITSREGVFAGGDIVTGAATVILAMGAGKNAAVAIDEYVRNK